MPFACLVFIIQREGEGGGQGPEVFFLPFGKKKKKIGRGTNTIIKVFEYPIETNVTTLRKSGQVQSHS